MENQKEVKQETKQEIRKLCPFISGFVMELSQISLKENGLVKTTNVAPCLKDKCTFFAPKNNICGIVLGIESLVTLKLLALETETETETTEQGEGTDE